MACLPSNSCPSSIRDAKRMKEGEGPHFHVLLARESLSYADIIFVGSAAVIFSFYGNIQ